MRITTRSAINISESLASFLLSSHIYHTCDRDPIFEKRMNHVDTAKYTISDVYLPTNNTAFEVKSVEHGTAALKGVIQSSIYLEQASKSILVMQKPRRRKLVHAIESMSEAHNVGVIWIVGIPTICSEETIKRATGGCTKPFKLWKQRRYTTTRNSIIQKSRSGWIKEYIETLEQVIIERSDEVFEYAIQPPHRGEGFGEIY